MAVGGVRADTTVLQVVTPAKTLSLTAADFATLPHTELKLPARGDEEPVTFSGVAMSELLTRAGVAIGKLNRKDMTTGVVVRCKDGYAVLFALAEFDPNFSTRTILLADKEDGAALPPTAAPFRVVTPGDKRGARSAHQVTSIEVLNVGKP